MADLWAVIEALRLASEAEADDASAQVETAFAEASDKFTQELVSTAPTYTAGDQFAIQRTVEQALVAARVTAIRTGLERVIIEAIASLATALNSPADAVKLAAINQAMKFNFEWIGGIPKIMEEPIRDALRSAVTEPVGAAQLARVLSDRLRGERLRYVVTLINTSLQTMDQTTIMEMTRNTGLDRFWYRGPDDRFNRPFCEHMVGKAYTREMLAECDNGQIPNVFISRGGFNCRHRLFPTSLASASRFPNVAVDRFEVAKQDFYRKDGAVAYSIRYIRPLSFINK